MDEADTKAAYKRDSTKQFVITFRTDKGSDLKNRNIKIQYWYDYDAHLEDVEKSFTLTGNNAIIIPYADIPGFDKLASVRIEYMLNFTEKRYYFLTKNNPVNIRKENVPNLINVEFVESPKWEIVYRTIKAVVKNDILTIVSVSKTKTVLPDYHREIKFEDSYTLYK